jgi:hypothetical protein
MKNITFTVLLTLVISLPLQANAQSFWDKVDGFLGNEGTSTSKQKPGLAETILSNEEVASGLKEALTIGAVAVIGMVGTQDGFNLDPNIHIPLPSSLQKVDSALSAVGMNSLTQDLELKLNRAAELAAPKAKDLFVQAIKDMTIEDAKGILNGPDNSATTYLIFSKRIKPYSRSNTIKCWSHQIV